MSSDSASSAEQVSVKLHDAFSKHRKLFSVDSSNFEDILGHTYSYGDDFTFSCFPGLLSLAISGEGIVQSNRQRDIIGYLDCGFLDERPNDWSHLNECKKSIFNSLNHDEKVAVAGWLEFVRSLFADDELYLELITSALRFWKSPEKDNAAEQGAAANP